MFFSVIFVRDKRKQTEIMRLVYLLFLWEKHHHHHLMHCLIIWLLKALTIIVCDNDCELQYRIFIFKVIILEELMSFYLVRLQDWFNLIEFNKREYANLNCFTKQVEVRGFLFCVVVTYKKIMQVFMMTTKKWLAFLIFLQKKNHRKYFFLFAGRMKNEKIQIW